MFEGGDLSDDNERATRETRNDGLGIRVKKLRLRTLRPFTTVVLVGKRNSGKTTLMRELFQVLKPEIGLIFTGTEGSFESFSSVFPELFVYDGYNEEALTWLIRIMRRNVKADRDPATNETAFKHAVVVLDDLAYDETVMKSKLLNKLFCNGRHWHITIFVSLQYCMSIQPALRINIDYLFCFKVEANDNMQRLYKSYFPVKKFSDFQSLMQECTNEYRCLFLNSASSSTDETDVLRWFRGNPNKVSMAGRADLLEFSNLFLSTQNDKFNCDDKSLESSEKKKKVPISKTSKNTKKTKPKVKLFDVEDNTESD